MTDPARWQQVKGILAEALETDDAAGRAAVVEKACRGDALLRQEVELFLGQQASGLERFAEGAGALLGQPSGAAANVGRRLGAYELTRELGRGGTGAVYLARRADGRFEQQVAVKLLKRGTDTDEVLRRFRAERRILARLEHPNIARLLDGGETEAGLPFFVMEYVDGVPLTTFARQRGLTVDERLQLFCKVCAAVQFAHQNLVVHRDLKPGNILVTADGEPKLLDFGLARLVGPEDGDATALEITVAEARRLTPAYASPEQARGATLTTASDVYSLGALLYELLTDQPPHRFSGPHPSPVELLQVIGEQEPLRPSLVAAARTRSRLRGDLDNVVGLAMRKDPARRYQTVSALADDLRRHLESRPVRAQPDTWRYRTAKFIGRNQTGVAVGALVFLALTAAVVVSVWEARQATKQAKEAEHRFNDVRALAHSFLFEFHDSIRDLPGSTPARRLLVTRALDYLQRLTKATGGDPALRRELAQAYVKVGDVQGKPNAPNLGDTKGAMDAYRHAAEIVASLPDDDDAAVAARAETWNALCDLLTWTGGKPKEALDLGKRALQIREKLAARAPDDPALQRDLAANLISVGDAASAGSMAVWDRMEQAKVSQENFERALRMFERLHADHPAEPQSILGLTRVHYRLGNIYHVLGMHEHNDPALLRRGLEHHRRSVEFREAMLAAEPNSGRARRNLADGLTMKTGVQTLLGDAKGALADCERGIELFAGLVAADPDDFWAKQDLAFAYTCAVEARRTLGDTDGAIAELDRAVAMYEALSIADPTSLMPVEHLVHALRGRTEICRERGDAAGVKESALRWVTCAERLSAASPKDGALREELARARAAAASPLG